MIRENRSNLYAVIYTPPSTASVNDGALPPTKFLAIYGEPGQAAWTLGIDDGVVYAFNSCGGTAEGFTDRRDRTQPNDGFLLRPAQ